MMQKRFLAIAIGLVIVLVGAPSAPALAQGIQAPAANRPQTPDRPLRQRLERALDHWCRWLSGYLYQVPGTELYTLNPTLGTGAAYRAIAGNQFAAAAAAYWLHHARPDEATARPLRGLIRLALGTHVAVKAIDRPDVQPWGATYSFSDDWHADLFAGTAGMLMRGALPADQMAQLRAILSWEADKQVEYGIRPKWRSMPGRSPASSVGESNAWSAALLQAARLNCPDSPRQAAWRSTAIDYSLNAICIPADMTSDEVVAGRPLAARVKGANFEPGGIQEHHGFYHPCYMGWTLAYEAFAHLIDRQLSPTERDTDVYLHHWRLAFDRLKQASFSNGRFIYCAGSDWNSYGYGNALVLPLGIFAAAQFNDPDALRLAEGWLALVEHEQALAGGSVQGVRCTSLQRLRVNDFAWYEAISGCSLAQALWVLDALAGARLPQPASDEQYHTRNTGTYHEPNARLVWHRDAQRWASFSWRSAFGQWQAVVQPIRRPHLLKFNYNGQGMIDATGTVPRTTIDWFATDTLPGGGFWSLGTVGRLAKSSMRGTVSPLVRQHVALIALAEGPTIFVDQCQALDQLWLLSTGSLGLRLAADVFTDNQVRLSVNGQPQTFGQHPCRDTWHDLLARWVTIEDSLTIRVLNGDGSFHLLQKHARPADRDEMLYRDDPVGTEESLLAHELYFGPAPYARPRVVAPQEWFRDVVLAMYCDPSQTPPDEPATITGHHPCFSIHLPRLRRTLAVNFSASQQTTDSPTGPVTVGPRSVRVVR